MGYLLTEASLIYCLIGVLCIIIIIVFYFHLKKQTIGTAQLTYRIIGIVGCQKSKCSSNWPPIITFTCILMYTNNRSHLTRR